VFGWREAPRHAAAAAIGELVSSDCFAYAFADATDFSSIAGT
jgi:hypothetical protein